MLSHLKDEEGDKKVISRNNEQDVYIAFALALKNSPQVYSLGSSLKMGGDLGTVHSTEAQEVPKETWKGGLRSSLEQLGKILFEFVLLAWLLS